jgi:hypothetical protein
MTMISAMIVLIPYCRATEPVPKDRRPCRSSVGVDIAAGVCFGSIRVIAAYNIDAHWGASFDISLFPDTFGHSTSPLEQEHREILDGYPAENHKSGEDRHAIDLLIGYWPKMTFKGPYLTIGGRFRRNGTPDMLIGLGYTFEIWKGISGTIGYHPGIIETFRKKEISYESLRASISYIF